MTNILFLILVLTVACSKNGGGGNPGPAPITYSAVFEYPSPSLDPGDGTVSVSATSVLKCLSSTGAEVALDLCPSIADAPPKIFKSPAGQIQIPVTGAVGGFVSVDVSEGEDFAQIPANEIEQKVISVLTCEAPHIKVGAECRIPGYEYVLSSYPAPTKTTPCSGSETLTRVVTGCQNNITLESVDLSNCASEPAPVLSVTHDSPTGNVVETNNGNTETYTCAMGSTVKVLTDITCGNPNQHKDGLSCVNDTFTALAYSFPANNLQPGDGTITVTATGITQCRNDHTSQIVSNALCTMPDPAPTQTQKSPAGNKSVVNAGNTEVYTYAEGSSSGTLTDITCGNVNQHKDGLTCVNDTFTVLAYIYPTNTMQPGDGTITVTATGISQCRNDHTSQIVSNALCTMPDPAPTQVQLSPAGNKTVVNAGNTEVYTYAEGSNSGTLTDITCGNAYQHKVGLTCVNDTFTALSFNYPANTLQPGDGTQVVSPSSVNLCQNDYTMGLVSPLLCTIPATPPTITYNSPAGTKQIVNGLNTETYTYLEGQTSGTLTDIICGNPDEYKSGLTCVAHVYTPSSFTFPANTLTPGQGTLVVNANGFTVCTNSLAQSVSLAKCSMPGTIPTTTYQAPAGNVSISYSRAIGGVVNIPVTEGYDYYGLSQASKDALFSANLVCQEIYTKNGTNCDTVIYTMAAIGTSHICGLKADGNVYCAGSNTHGQLGDNTDTGNHSTPFLVPFGSPVKAIYAAGNRTCGLLMNGTVKCMGQNNYGELANGSASNRLIPTTATFSTTVKSLHMTDETTCALLTNDTVECAGHGLAGQIGDGAATNRLSPSAANFGGTVKKLVVARFRMCAIIFNDTVKCVGFNSYGQLADGTTADRSTPVNALFGGTVKDLQLGTYHTCAHMANDTVKCAGENSAGALGDGTTTNRPTPVNSNFGTIVSISVGEQSTCAIIPGNTVKCSGSNTWYRLGYVGSSSTPTPLDISYGGQVSKLFANVSPFNTCAIMNNGTVTCAGANNYGELGNGNSGGTRASTPTATLFGSGVVSLSVTSQDKNICAVTATAIRCAGSNSSGQLGDGTFTDRFTPVNFNF